MPTLQLDFATFLYLVFSGFMTVWTYRTLTKSDKKSGEFELFCLSLFWGFIVMFLFSWTNNRADEATKAKGIEIFNNPFAAGFLLAIYGIALGFMGSRLRGFFNFLLRFVK